MFTPYLGLIFISFFLWLALRQDVNSPPKIPIAKPWFSCSCLAPLLLLRPTADPASNSSSWPFPSLQNLIIHPTEHLKLQGINIHLSQQMQLSQWNCWQESICISWWKSGPKPMESKYCRAVPQIIASDYKESWMSNVFMLYRGLFSY